MRIIGFDIHRLLPRPSPGRTATPPARPRDMRRNLLTAFAVTLSREDIVVVEADPAMPRRSRA